MGRKELRERFHSKRKLQFDQKSKTDRQRQNELNDFRAVIQSK